MYIKQYKFKFKKIKNSNVYLLVLMSFCSLFNIDNFDSSKSSEDKIVSLKIKY